MKLLIIIGASIFIGGMTLNDGDIRIAVFLTTTFLSSWMTQIITMIQCMVGNERLRCFLNVSSHNVNYFLNENRVIDDYNYVQKKELG